jgi:hypothetical protein
VDENDVCCKNEITQEKPAGNTPCSRQATAWRTLMAHYKEQILVGDFFTVETVEFKTRTVQ